MEAVRKWLLMTYNVPRDPSANRVYVWRKLKKLGAVALQDAVWVLPNTPQTLEQFRWLAAEIVEMHGEATLWDAKQLLDRQDAALVKEFQGKVEKSYKAMLTSLKRKRRDLAALSRQYQQTLALDYFRCELSREVREAMIAAKGEMER